MTKKAAGGEVAPETKTKKAAGGEVAPDAAPHYQEWDVKINGGVAEKLKISRPCVKIKEEEAEILNRGVLTGGNNYAKMYFLPE